MSKLTKTALSPYATLPIEHSLPDPNTYTIIINERQRAIIANALNDMALAAEVEDVESDDIQMAMVLADMFADTDMIVSPGVNGFVL